MKFVDLHTHTTASDGELSPKQLIDYALKRRIKVVSITDHDTISGIKIAKDYAKDKDIQFVEGVEISCDELQLELYDIHILGLFVDSTNKELNDFLDEQHRNRIDQKKLIIKKLNELGYKISFDELINEAGDSLGRPHIAKIIIKRYPEKFSSISNVFDNLLGTGEKAFVRQKKSNIAKAINIIRQSGGIPILAHPGIYNQQDLIMKKFLDYGGKGIEVDYPYNKIYGFGKDKEEKIISKMKKYAKENKLLITGGSDFHESSRRSNLGDAGISLKELREIEKLKSD